MGILAKVSKTVMSPKNTTYIFCNAVLTQLPLQRLLNINLIIAQLMEMIHICASIFQCLCTYIQYFHVTELTNK